jgi:plasmid stability protein
MGQALIRNLDDALLADYREAALQNQRSLEAELREALARARPMTATRQNELLDRLARIRAMTPEGVAQTPSQVLVRRDRDEDRD